MWHASSALLSGPEHWARPLARRDDAPEVDVLLRNVSLALLRNVGARPIWIHAGPAAVHARRPLSDEEEARCYAACPAFRDAPKLDPANGPGIVHLETLT